MCLRRSVAMKQNTQGATTATEFKTQKTTEKIATKQVGEQHSFVLLIL